jgi:hypothetical protein
LLEKIRNLLGYNKLNTESERTEFTDLTRSLFDVLVDFSILTLKTVEKKKQAPLSPTQMEDAVFFDLQFRIQQIQDPEFIDIRREKAIETYNRLS